MKDFKDIKDIKDIIDFMNDNQSEILFAVWYKMLCAQKPKIESEQVTLTKENFRKALRMAFMAGYNEPSKSTRTYKGAK